MARKRRSHRKTRSSSTRKRAGLSARPRRRRRRMGAGAGAFKMLSNPIIGGAVGALAGLVVNKLMKKVNLPGGALTAAILPIGGAFFASKKFPFVGAGMAAGVAGAFIVQKFPALADDAHFINDNLLNAPFELDASPSDEIPYSLRDALLNDYGMVKNSPQQFRDPLNDFEEDYN